MRTVLDGSVQFSLGSGTLAERQGYENVSGDDRQGPSNPFARVFDVDEVPSHGPVVNLVNLIIQEFLRARAQQFSIILASPEQLANLPVGGLDIQGCAVRFLMNDEWKDVMVLPLQVVGPLVNRLKVMSDLDIARRPHQDGQVQVRHAGGEYTLSITISVTPSGTEEVLVARHAAA